jgi:hypothetical protein
MCHSLSAKRYERMMRAHGIAPNAATIKPAPSRSIKSDRHDSIEKPSKKRKADAFIEENGATDDDETFTNSIKSDPVNDKEKFMVKEEEHGHGQQLSMNDAANLMQYYDTPPSYSSALGGLGGEQDYGSDYGGGASGYATPTGGDYGLHSQPYDFGSAYGNAGFSGVPGIADQGLQYQPMMQFLSDPQGRSDSPVIVE